MGEDGLVPRGLASGGGRFRWTCAARLRHQLTRRGLRPQRILSHRSCSSPLWMDEGSQIGSGDAPPKHRSVFRALRAIMCVRQRRPNAVLPERRIRRRGCSKRLRHCSCRARLRVQLGRCLRWLRIDECCAQWCYIGFWARQTFASKRGPMPEGNGKSWADGPGSTMCRAIWSTTSRLACSRLWRNRRVHPQTCFASYLVPFRSVREVQNGFDDG
mmetsp:Transcript_104892/g.301867  ORF Transcript_104892/g.301867 Transcript_104892/m.301867 type:complete len:215 (-) Transcript_104892:2311-2955(-)